MPSSARSDADPRTVAIIGLGLIGGSLARDLAAAGVRVLGYDRDPGTLAAALEADVVGQGIGPSFEGVEAADTVVLAVPVAAAPTILRVLAPRLDGVGLLHDVGSTKAGIAAAAADACLADRFVGGHPLAGDDRAGWGASRPGLFVGARTFLCPTAATSPEALARAERLWALVGAETHRLDAETHDRLVAWTSHLPQVVASALALALDEAGVPREELGAGGRGMTRLAASAPELWAGIAADNAVALGGALDGLETVLARFRRTTVEADVAKLATLFTAARAWAGEPSPREVPGPRSGTGEGGLVVAFQGELGAHSEGAIRAFFPGPTSPLPCREFRDVTDAVASGAARFGLLPVENTTAGSVVPAYHAIARSGLQVVGEVVRPIRHDLLGLPGAAVGRLRRVLSHPVALAQCSEFLAARPWIEAMAFYDTAGAARELAVRRDPALAAIAGRHAADHYGLAILAADIQDRPDNRTRFLVLARPGEDGLGRPGAKSRPLRSALFIDVADRPGALADVLRPFARRSINLSHIQSTPGEGIWQYRFIVEVDADVASGAAADAVAEARGLGADIRVLGRYPPAPDPRKREAGGAVRSR
jgi:prephenate dehydratase/prephenate dehydrogenase